MSVPDPLATSVQELAAGVRAGRFRARDLSEAYLDRIARLDGKLGTFLLVDAAGARAQADARRRAGGGRRGPGPLAGVPVGLKDIYVTRGLPTTCGSQDPARAWSRPTKPPPARGWRRPARSGWAS